MICHAVCVGGLAVAPQFNNGEMVLPIDLGHRLEPQIAIILAPILRQLLGDRGSVLSLRGITSTWVTTATAAPPPLRARRQVRSGWL